MPTSRFRSTARPRLLPIATAIALIAGPGAATLPVTAHAQASTPRQHDIPPGPLGPALSGYAASAGVLLSFDPALTQGRRTAGLRGSFSAREGLERLLNGTGLALVVRPDGGYALREVEAPVATLPQVRVSADREDSATSPVVGYVATRSATGTKTDTPLLEIAQSITVVGREFIEDTHAQGLSEALSYSAGVMRTEANDHTGDEFILRGFAVSRTGSTYRDGMRYMTNVYNGRQEPYGLERVELLRGAASVLYGQAAPGGVVNAVSKLPTSTPIHEVRAELGNQRRRQLATDHAGPLTEDGRWTYRLTALARKSDTSVDHVPDDRVYLAPAVTWRPDAATSLTLLGSYQRSLTDYMGGLPAEGTVLPNPNGRISSSLYPGEAGYGQANIRAFDLGYRFEHAFSDQWRVRQQARVFRARNDMPSVSADSWADDGLRLAVRSAQDRIDKSRNAVIDTQMEGTLRTGEARHTVLAGVDVTRSRHQTERHDREVAALDLFDPTYGTPLGERVPSRHSSWDGSRRLGIYLQDQIKLRDRWVVSLGTRYDWAKDWTRDMFGDGRSHEDSEALTGRAGVVYLTPVGLAPFASFSQSFEPTSGRARDGASFKPTMGEQYEVGIRYQPAGQALLVSAALYNLTQTNVLTPDPVAPTQFNVQTGEVRSRGVELEATLPVGRDARLIAAYAYTDVRITRSNNAAEVGARQGGTPYHQASVWGDYRFAAWGLPQLRVGAGVRYVGSSKGLWNSAVTSPAYAVIDAMASYEWDAWTLSLNARNLTDRETLTYTYGAFYGPRRTVTAGLAYRW